MEAKHTKTPEEEILELRQDLNDARNGWEQAAAELREADAQNKRMAGAIKEVMEVAERSYFKAISLPKLREIMEKAGIK